MKVDSVKKPAFLFVLACCLFGSRSLSGKTFVNGVRKKISDNAASNSNLPAYSKSGLEPLIRPHEFPPLGACPLSSLC